MVCYIESCTIRVILLYIYINILLCVSFALFPKYLAIHNIWTFIRNIMEDALFWLFGTKEWDYLHCQDICKQETFNTTHN